MRVTVSSKLNLVVVPVRLKADWKSHRFCKYLIRAWTQVRASALFLVSIRTIIKLEMNYTFLSDFCTIYLIPKIQEKLNTLYPNFDQKIPYTWIKTARDTVYPRPLAGPVKWLFVSVLCLLFPGNGKALPYLNYWTEKWRWICYRPDFLVLKIAQNIWQHQTI